MKYEIKEYSDSGEFRWPPVDVLYDVLHDVRDTLPRNETTAIRFQIYANGDWAVCVGVSDHDQDQDHRDYWGAASYITRTCTSADMQFLAEGLLTQARNAYEDEQAVAAKQETNI